MVNWVEYFGAQLETKDGKYLIILSYAVWWGWWWWRCVNVFSNFVSKWVMVDSWGIPVRYEGGVKSLLYMTWDEDWSFFLLGTKPTEEALNGKTRIGIYFSAHVSSLYFLHPDTVPSLSSSSPWDRWQLMTPNLCRNTTLTYSALTHSFTDPTH